MKDFEYFAPTTLQEAVAMLAEHGGEAKLLAGGTDIVGQMKDGALSPKVVISLSRVEGLDRIKEDADGGVTIGARATFRDVAVSPVVKRQYPLLAEAAGQVGSSQVRSRGTIGGNLCNASPAADAAPPLLVLNACLEILSLRGSRTVLLEEFFVGPQRTVLREDEVLASIRLPRACAKSGGAFLRLGRRKAMDISIVSAAAYVVLGGCSAVVLGGRVALGSVAPVPISVREVEEIVRGQVLDHQVLEKAARAAAVQARPISDIRASAEYRREMAYVLVKRVLSQAYDQACRAG